MGTVKKLKNFFNRFIFIFSVFILMAAAAYFSSGYIIKQRLHDKAEETISVFEANVRAGLSEAEVILHNAGYFVEDMLNRNASTQEIHDYLAFTTQWMRQNKDGLFNYYGIYGYINGEFIDSIGLNPDSDYVPQTRPWYHAAVQSGNTAGYTIPYTDWHTDDTLISAVYNIFDKDKNNAGVLIMDVEISWLVDTLTSGILLNQDMIVLSHPDDSYTGMYLQDIGRSFYEIAVMLRNEKAVAAHKVKDINGMTCAAFFSQIFNGWYIGITMPYHQFYRDLYILALIFFILSFVLSVFLCYLLPSVKIRTDMEIVSADYLFLSLLNDVLKIARLQTGDEPVRFFTNIDSAVPRRLSGDDTLIRQMLFNLLLNSIKNTENGFIGFFVTVDKRRENKVWLKFTVTDTGEGINQVNRELYIAKTLCAAMDGEFFTESGYGRGNTFTVHIPQGIESSQPFAAVTEGEKKKVLVYEGNFVCAKSISWSLENLNVPYTVVTTQNEFKNTLPCGEWFYIIIGYGLYENAKPLMKEKNFFDGKKPPVAVVTDSETCENIPGVRFISLPAHTLSIANILNNETE